MTLNDAARILISTLGSQLYLAYIAVVVLGTAVASVLIARRTTPRPFRNRAALYSLLALRVILTGAWWAAFTFAPGVAAILPGLERFVAFLGLALLAWPFLVDRDHSAIDTGLAAGILVSTVGLVLTVALAPADGRFNRSSADAVWTVSSLLVAAAATASLAGRVDRQPLAASGMGVMALGFGSHILLGPSGGDFPALVRLGEAFAYPILCAAVLGFRPPAPKLEIEAVPPGPADPAPPVRPGVFIELVGLGLSEDSRELTRRLVRALARALGAEMCLLLSPPDEAGRFAIAGGYDLIQEREVEGASLDDRRSPVLGDALTHRRAASLPGRSRSPDMDALRGALNLRSAGPAVLAPLECDGRMYGGLLLLAPYTRQEWTEDQKQALFGIAPLIARRLRRLEQNDADLGTAESTSEGNVSLPELEDAISTPPEALAPTGVMDSEGVPGDDSHPTPVGLSRKTKMQSAIAGRPRATDSGQFQRVAFELQMALQELADTRSRLGRDDSDASAPDRLPPRHGAGSEEIIALVRSVRQPIASGLGYTDLVLGESVGLLGAMQRKFLERVREGLRKADELLHELVRAASAAEVAPAPRAPVEFGRCLDEAMGRTAGGVRNRAQSLLTDIPPSLLGVLVEEDALPQILEHLLAHASTVSSTGAEIGLGARVQPEESPAFLHLWVKDQGPGIPPTELGQVFGSLGAGVQASAADSPESGGDLAIVKAMTEAAGGRVWVDSLLGEGTTISVLLPISAWTQPGPGALPG
ncbi:MAG: GAF domain-containing sensor histidine kinase [Anaerolineales bacterium]